MSLDFDDDDEESANPLDLIEQLVCSNDWAFDRRSEEELAVEVPGQWCNYSLYFAWREALGAMHFTCAFDMKVPVTKHPQVYELLAAINEKLWIGHFSLWEEDCTPMFRHTSLIKGGFGLDPEQVEEIVDIAVSECERFYPAFQFLIWGGKTAKEAIAAAMLDTVGEA